jgi:hypothetical protein
MSSILIRRFRGPNGGCWKKTTQAFSKGTFVTGTGVGLNRHAIATAVLTLERQHWKTLGGMPSLRGEVAGALDGDASPGEHRSGHVPELEGPAAGSGTGGSW